MLGNISLKKVKLCMVIGALEQEPTPEPLESPVRARRLKLVGQLGSLHRGLQGSPTVIGKQEDRRHWGVDELCGKLLGSRPCAAPNSLACGACRPARAKALPTSLQIVASASLFLAGKINDEARSHEKISNMLLKEWFGKDNPQLHELSLLAPGVAAQGGAAARQHPAGQRAPSPGTPTAGGYSPTFWQDMWAAVLEAERALLYTVRARPPLKAAFLAGCSCAMLAGRFGAFLQRLWRCCHRRLAGWLVHSRFCRWAGVHAAFASCHSPSAR